MPRALLSVSDKTGIAELGRGLVAHGFTLVSTGGTRRALIEAGLAVTSVSDLTGFPEMMDGRVKTLHPALHGGILARRDRPDDLAALERLGLGLIDVVVVNLYPFSKAASNPETPFDALVEEIDIGGPSLVRAAAKNFRDVLVVVDPADYPRLLSALDRGPSLDFRYELMVKAFAHTARYDTTIATTLLYVKVGPNGPERADLADSHFRPTIEFDGSLAISAEKIRDLRYGENPHQHAAWYREKGDLAFGADGAGLGAASILQGRELSYTNLLDLDAAARIALEFREPAAVVIKHTNPCGAAVGHSIAEAYGRARDADRVAAFGGIVGLNRPVDLAAAEAIVSTFIEAVIAPAVDEAARPVLARKANMRVVTAQFDALKGPTTELRSILGAILVQERDRVVEAQKPWTPTRICAHVKSNTVLFTTADRTLAIGAGQTSRVDAVRVALMKAGSSSLAGSVAASDAFFPFRDGLDAVASAGATAVVHPGGSVRDEEVIAAADEHGMAMVLTGRRHFRH
jgi:phosphoribosylaminoimidazolecarboxamide formyltransferase/IMP cyclohydrolase